MASELKVNTITEATSGSGITFAKDIIPATPLSHRNMIINGAMQVAQRGTSFTSQTGISYHLDRWETTANNLGSGQYRVDQDTDSPDGFHFSTKLSCTTSESSQDANNQMWFAQHIEGNNVQHLKFFQSSPSTVTFSFWVKSNTTGKYAFQLKLSDNGSTINNVNTRVYATDFTINSANTWEYKKLSITLDSSTAETKVTNNTFSMGFLIWLAAGSSRQGTTPETWSNNANQATNTIEADNFLGNTSNYFNITGVQLELGTVATPFEHRSYGDELLRCQRYYQRLPDASGSGSAYASVGTGYVGATTQADIHIDFKTVMRTSPSFNINGCHIRGNGYAPVVTSIGSTYFGSNSGFAVVTASSGGMSTGNAVLLRRNNSNSDYIELDAEFN